MSMLHSDPPDLSRYVDGEQNPDQRFSWARKVLFPVVYGVLWLPSGYLTYLGFLNKDPELSSFWLLLVIALSFAFWITESYLLDLKIIQGDISRNGWKAKHVIVFCVFSFGMFFASTLYSASYLHAPEGNRIEMARISTRLQKQLRLRTSSLGSLISVQRRFEDQSSQKQIEAAAEKSFAGEGPHYATLIALANYYNTMSERQKNNLESLRKELGQLEKSLEPLSTPHKMYHPGEEGSIYKWRRRFIDAVDKALQQFERFDTNLKAAFDADLVIKGIKGACGGLPTQQQMNNITQSWPEMRRDMYFKRVTATRNHCQKEVEDISKVEVKVPKLSDAGWNLSGPEMMTLRQFSLGSWAIAIVLDFFAIFLMIASGRPRKAEEKNVHQA